MKRLFGIVILLLAFAGPSQASPYIPLIDASAARHGVDKYILRAIVQVESEKLPWVFNLNGEGFRFGSKANAIRALQSAAQNPWFLKIRPADRNRKSVRLFFSTREAAQRFLHAETEALKAGGFRVPKQRTDSGWEVKPGEARIRKMNLISTDIGLAQINYKWHSKNGQTVSQWFDPAFNLDYAAKHLADLKRTHGDWFTAVGYYHSDTRSLRDTYKNRVQAAYVKELQHETSRLSR